MSITSTIPSTGTSLEATFDIKPVLPPPIALVNTGKDGRAKAGVIKRKTAASDDDTGSPSDDHDKKPDIKSEEASAQGTPTKRPKVASSGSSTAESKGKAGKGGSAVSGEVKAKIVQECLATGLSTLGAKNLASKYGLTERQVYNLLQGGKPGNLRGRLVSFAGAG